MYIFVIFLESMAAVHTDEAKGLAWTGSGCDRCERDFRFTYSLATDEYTPQRCPGCTHTIAPPERLLDAAKRLQASPHAAVVPLVQQPPIQITIAREKRGINHGLHCFLVFLTGGCWCPLWIAACCGCCCERPCES